MKALVGSVLLLGAISSVCGSSSPQIRGVSPSDQAKYLSAEFACVLNGKLTKLPQSRVNDEFCDCDAGQDEPGTSACSHLEQSKFHCENDGFFPEKIHTSRVDDGICDCCDGSDEDLRSPCKNTCSSAAEVVRKKAEERLEVVRAGFTKRQAVVEGDIADYFSSVQDAESSTSKEMQELLLLKERVVMHKEREELREKKHRLEVARQRQAESQSRTSEGGEGVHREHFSDAAEKEAIEELDFEGLDAVRVADDDASMNALEDERASEVLDARKHGLKSFIELPDHTRVSLAEYLRMDHRPRPTKKLCTLFMYLVSSCWALTVIVRCIYVFHARRVSRTADQMRREDFLGPLFNGGAEGRKKIGLYALRTVGIIISPVRALVELVLFAPLTLWDVLSSPELAGSLIDRLPDFPSPSRSIWFRQVGGGSVYNAYTTAAWGVRVTWDAPIYAYHYLLKLTWCVSCISPKLDDEVTLPVAQSLREALREIEADINKLEKERDEKRKAAKFDFGPDRAFFALKDNCIEKRIEKYMYKFCAFGEVKQDQTKLGKWDGWVRDESNASSSGEAYVAHTKMKYSGGQKCYKGPERSVVVHLECGVEDEIVSVDEPSTCVYGMVVRSPLACSADMLAKAQEDVVFWTRKH